MAAAGGVPPPAAPAAPAAPGQDPMFFAEEFAARRRRYIPVTVNLARISGEGVYKTYTFPFITGEKPPLEITAYKDLFSQAINTEFRQQSGYTPTTRFESMTYQAYIAAVGDPNKGLENARRLFVTSLMEPGLLVDLSRVTAMPVHSVGTSSQFDNPPNTNPWTVPGGIPSSRTAHLDMGPGPPAAAGAPLPPPIFITNPTYAHGFLSREFVNYLQGIAGAVPPGGPSPCSQVLFKDQSLARPDGGLSVDMVPFIMAIESTFGAPTNPSYNSWFPFVRDPALPGSFNCPADRVFRDGFGKSINASTVEEAYTTLKRMNGEPIMRYLSFIRFLYIFFDHIPAAQEVISSLMVPLVGMVGGILMRGRYSTRSSTPLELILPNRFGTADAIKEDTTFSQAKIALDPAKSRNVAAGAVVNMYHHINSSWSAIKMIIRAGTSNPGEAVKQVGYRILTGQQQADEFNAIQVVEYGPPLSSLQKLYADRGLVEFDLPSIGSANMILPAVLGVPPDHITSLVYNFATHWFSTADAYRNQHRAIIAASDQYNSYTSGRFAYTTEGLAGILTIPPDGTYVQILERPAFPLKPPPAAMEPAAYIEQNWTDLPSNTRTRNVDPNHLPWSWGELLYPAFVSHAIVGLQHLRPIGNTNVRPCFQGPDISIVFPPASEIQGGSGYVSVNGADLESHPSLMAAVFEFPASMINITLPPGSALGARSLEAMANYPGDADHPAGAAGSFTMNRGSRSTTRDRSHGEIEYRLVNVLSLRLTIPNILAWTRVPMTLQSTPFTSVPILQRRTSEAWTALPDSASFPEPAPGTVPASLKFENPVSGQIILLPAVEPELFLSSFFDWKLQLHYLRILRSFLEGRTEFQSERDKIRVALDGVRAAKSGVLETVVDNDASRVYIRDNTLPNLIGGPSPYAGFRNVLFNIVGPTAPGKLADIVKMKSLIDSHTLTTDTKRFYLTQLPTPVRGPLVYNIDIDDYLALLTARTAVMASLQETRTAEQKRIDRENETQRQLNVARLIEISKRRLIDPYSQLVDEIVTRAIYTLPS